MSSRAHAALLALLLALTAGPVAGAALAPDGSAASPGSAAASTAPITGPGQPAVQSQGDSITADETTMRVALRENGDARWTVTVNVTLDSDQRRATFESFATDFENGEVGDLLAPYQVASDRAATATGREMAITEVQRTSDVHGDTGQLILRFTWTEFGRADGDRLRVDDAFNTTTGTWLETLDETQRLVVVPPDGYDLVRASPAGYEVSVATLRWEGGRTFEPGELSIVYERTGGFPLWAVAVVAALLGGGGSAYVLSRRNVGLPIPVPLGGDDLDEGGAAAAATAGDAGGDDPEPAPADEPTDDEIDEELLSDEERIERLLDSNGGRMKQANIVKETGWSNAKVSQLLSSMDEADRIDKLRIGRENLISFPDEDVADVSGDES